MHVAGADWPDAISAQGERNKHCPAINTARRNVPGFRRNGVLHVGRNARLTLQEQPLNFFATDTMLASLWPVPAIPIEACNFHHLHICNTSILAGFKGASPACAAAPAGSAFACSLPVRAAAADLDT